MAIVIGKIPRRYHSKLEAAHDRLRLFTASAEDVPPARVDPDEVLMPHTVWFLHLGHYLENRPWNRTVRRGEWAYYFPRARGKMVCVHLQIARGKSESISLSEGPLVDKIVRLVQRAKVDKRARETSLELRVLMAPALHFACVWLKGRKGVEYFVPVTPVKGNFGYGKWVTRADLREGLTAKAERHLRAREASGKLLRERSTKL